MVLQTPKRIKPNKHQQAVSQAIIGLEIKSKAWIHERRYFMTANQIAYWRNVETNRSNLANEFETMRSNRARESENWRSNLAREYETGRHNVKTEGQGDRSLGYEGQRTAQGWVQTATKVFDSLSRSIQASHSQRTEDASQAFRVLSLLKFI